MLGEAAQHARQLLMIVAPVLHRAAGLVNQGHDAVDVRIVFQNAAVELLRDARVGDLLTTIAPATGLRTRRSQPYLEWRYGFAPLGYRAIAAGRDPAEGIAVFRVRRRGRAAEAALCELLVPDGATRAARHLARTVSRSTGADYVVRLGRAAPAAGFLPLPGQGPILTWRKLATTDTDAPALGTWDLSLGDVELL